MSATYQDVLRIALGLPGVASVPLAELRRVIAGAWRMVASKRQIAALDGVLPA